MFIWKQIPESSSHRYTRCIEFETETIHAKFGKQDNNGVCIKPLRGGNNCTLHALAFTGITTINIGSEGIRPSVYTCHVLMKKISTHCFNKAFGFGMCNSFEIE